MAGVPLCDGDTSEQFCVEERAGGRSSTRPPQGRRTGTAVDASRVQGLRPDLGEDGLDLAALLRPYIICAGPNFMLGLRTHASTQDGDVFHFDRVGLDHMGVHVESQAELEKWRAHLDEQGIKTSGPVSSPYGLHLNIKDPDGIATEFFAPNPQA